MCVCPDSGRTIKCISGTSMGMLEMQHTWMDELGFFTAWAISWDRHVLHTSNLTSYLGQQLYFMQTSWRSLDKLFLVLFTERLCETELWRLFSAMPVFFDTEQNKGNRTLPEGVMIDNMLGFCTKESWCAWNGLRVLCDILHVLRGSSWTKD